MSHQITTDSHEWINKIPTVPIYYLAKLQPREWTWEDQRGKKTLLDVVQFREKFSFSKKVLLHKIFLQPIVYS